MEPADPVITPLEILGLRPGASSAEVNAAFRALSLVVHPDVCPAGAGLFRVLSEARDAALQPTRLNLTPFPPPRPEDAHDPTAFHWFRARPGIITAGTPDGMISVVLAEGQWMWSIPGGRTSLARYSTPAAARSAAEAAYLKFFSNGA